MDISTLECYEKILLLPGKCYVTRKKVVISTLLGSCVSVCAYDALAGVVGMNHFLNSDEVMDMSKSCYTDNKGQFAISSTDLLLDSMLAAGARINSIRVKVFGGASLMEATSGKGTLFSIGKKNVECITNYLERNRIPIDARDLGGNRSRQIYYFSDTFEVLMKYSSESRRQPKVNAVRLLDNMAPRFRLSA